MRHLGKYGVAMAVVSRNVITSCCNKAHLKHLECWRHSRQPESSALRVDDTKVDWIVHRLTAAAMALRRLLLLLFTLSGAAFQCTICRNSDLALRVADSLTR